ncbi:MAG TPA: tryptophan--tRNA ligase [Hypericibacter adhaerens]|jgi:tryptophanyl-tRNA synthetase|uniref:Tryptophan--tRNA ligase n=1 Tax=Hypericibacter adhaerens TaxID=2602016 RepID=A0A5J6N591_9PROT|nr:tryptophan--tRNA ligase [Hypericibacter adhaerens]QEX25272.1 tryptophan--tRNA ligase [Hypericibacter adhaerens]HWA44294.1 tryptophan--tRNA ligase [Hypericibacter adhaerens]
MNRIFSGVQPTGNLHLGNYLGAIRNWVRLQDQFDCIFCIVDLHAITVWQDPAELRKSTREVTAAYLAAGIDGKKHIVFNQSQVPGHAQLAWIFNCVARLGWLNRMTQFKEKSGKQRENASAGLYVYPNLMAADILLYKATHVPVGEDQKQHVELARDIAQKFNNDFGVNLFPLPEPMIQGAAARVMSLRDGTKKMSKSDPSDMSRINMTDDADLVAQKIRKAKTDPHPLPGPEALGAGGQVKDEALTARPEAFNLLGIYAALSDRPLAAVIAEFEGKEFSAFKQALTDLAVATLGKIGNEMKRLLADPAEIDGVLRHGAERARAVSTPILREVEDVVGFLRP